MDARSQLAVAHSEISHQKAAWCLLREPVAHRRQPWILAPANDPHISGPAEPLQRARQDSERGESIGIEMAEDQRFGSSVEPFNRCAKFEADSGGIRT